MSGAAAGESPRYVVERRDSKRWAVIDTQGRTSVTRLVNEYATRRDAQRLVDSLNAGHARRVARP